MAERQKNQFPNHLREQREEKAMISRALLAARCTQLAEQDKTRYRSIGISALRDLELGLSLPRRVTASTLAVALETDVSIIFPKGVDDPKSRNPTGKTGVTKGDARRGRPKK